VLDCKYGYDQTWEYDLLSSKLNIGAYSICPAYEELTSNAVRASPTIDKDITRVRN
jgi:hypothetical protein